VSRLFVAVWPPAEVVEVLRALPRVDQTGVRWVRPEQWHVTVRFLGEADEAAATAALGGLRAPAAEAVVGPRVSRLGRTVVCVPVAGLDEVAGAVAEATASIGQPPDPRPFAGHITIARLRHRAACGVTGRAVSARFPVGSVDLVRSRTGRGGARYETVCRVDLHG
jgi:2'-5' RNA ligase